MTDANQTNHEMQRSRSFSLLSFLLLSGVAALSIAIYFANNEVAETRAMMAKQRDEMGYIEVVDKTQLHVRRLGSYPQMSFAFRYQVPEKKEYLLKIGSGILDPETDQPKAVLFTKTLSERESQGMLIVSLVEMPTHRGVRWVVEVIDGNSMNRITCSAEEFDWLQTYLAAFPTEDQTGPGYGLSFFPNNLEDVAGHGETQIFDPDKTVELYF